jgi:hypothetical protein
LAVAPPLRKCSHAWAGSVVNAAKHYRNMGVTYSSVGEYGNAIDILPPP